MALNQTSGDQVAETSIGVFVLGQAIESCSLNRQRIVQLLPDDKLYSTSTESSHTDFKMGKIATMEYFRVPPRWLFVKITDEAGNVGWGEASLEGHTQAVEGCLDAWFERYNGFEADDIEHIWQMSWRTTFYRGGPVFMSALAGIDIALWDLKGGL